MKALWICASTSVWPLPLTTGSIQYAMAHGPAGPAHETPLQTFFLRTAFSIAACWKTSPRVAGGGRLRVRIMASVIQSGAILSTRSAFHTFADFPDGRFSITDLTRISFSPSADCRLSVLADPIHTRQMQTFGTCSTGNHDPPARTSRPDYPIRLVSLRSTQPKLITKLNLITS